MAVVSHEISQKTIEYRTLDNQVHKLELHDDPDYITVADLIDLITDQLDATMVRIVHHGTVVKRADTVQSLLEASSQSGSPIVAVYRAQSNKVDVKGKSMMADAKRVTLSNVSELGELSEMRLTRLLNAISYDDRAWNIFDSNSVLGFEGETVRYNRRFLTFLLQQCWASPTSDFVAMIIDIENAAAEAPPRASAAPIQPVPLSANLRSLLESYDAEFSIVEISEENIQLLVAMGFDTGAVRTALLENNNNVDAALEDLCVGGMQ
jgi:hypothetical protein